MSTTHNLALWNTNECLERICQGSDVAKHILDADCCHEENAFALFSLPRQLPRLFTVRFTAPADFTPGDVFTLKGREFALKTRTMEDPSGSVFSAGAVVRLDIDMEQDLAFVTTGGDVVNFGTTDPLGDGVASAGTSTKVAREDHVHPSSHTVPDYNNAIIYGTADYVSRIISIGTPAYGEPITIPEDGFIGYGFTALPENLPSTTVYDIRVYSGFSINGAPTTPGTSFPVTTYMYPQGASPFGFRISSHADTPVRSGDIVRFGWYVSAQSVIQGNATYAGTGIYFFPAR